MEQITQVPTKVWKRIESVLLSLEEKDDYVSEDEARELLGKPGQPLSQGTLYNKIQAGKIPTSFYTISPVTGKRFYSKSKLMGLKK